MRTGQASGLQVAFLIYAVMLIAVPMSGLVVRWAALEGTGKVIVEKGAHFFLAGLVIALFRPLRRFAREALSTPIPAARRSEVALASIATLAIAFGTAAGLALWSWVSEGPARVERMTVDVDAEVARAYSGAGWVRLALAVGVAPVVEELVFRGFIYRAFMRQWGWLASTLATSVLFGLYHTYFWSAFASALAYTCVLRRGGSLRAPIAAHMFYNLMLWWPLLGQHVFPFGAPLADPATWRFQALCLAFVAIALPTYAWMSRDREAIAPTVPMEPHGAFPK